MEFLRRNRVGLVIITILTCFFLILIPKQLSKKSKIVSQTAFPIEIQLPDPAYSSPISIEEALKKRRSIRQYKNQPITLQQVSQLLWAAQGITSGTGLRTAPSAGACYPLELYFIASNVSNLSPGVYHYEPTKHTLKQLKAEDISSQLAQAALGQQAVKSSAANIVITAVFSRMTKKYGKIGRRFALMEAGHVAQNIYLQSVSLNLATVSIGAFDITQVRESLGIKGMEPVYILPVGAK
ncbi:TPA: SagB/ThcOx family dehydrogenase [Legionella pneumophila]|nr:SagB/ThcOx family dehydrogenase [Legionella pneumophila]HAT8593128.1 SagB/ThcOx family dehydrogenase [Legionella pneumophila]HAU1577256.1 SagB/ThcOx family dehydrogenase [Legionella pneumophila]HAU1681442.1 SagB/ThcOx family dehydrogenase [Legionella pneumophila]HAU3700950.1 SagB/ThcOx family dehydrogenase [Legionella pneumophila]